MKRTTIQTIIIAWALMLLMHSFLYLSISFSQWDFGWIYEIPNWQAGNRGGMVFIFTCINVVIYLASFGMVHERKQHR